MPIKQPKIVLVNIIVIAYNVYDLWSIQIASAATTTSLRYAFFYKVLVPNF